MTALFMSWQPNSDVYGEAAGLAFGGRVLDLVVTHCDDGTFEWDVIDNSCTDERIAYGTAFSAAEARREAESAARREALSLV